MIKFSKVAFILALFLIISILRSCSFGIECSDETYYYSLNRIKIQNVDNSATHPIVVEDNQMLSMALAFNILLYDSTEYYYNPDYASLMESIPYAGFGIQSAYAWFKGCPIYFMPKQNVDRVEVITTYAINQNIVAGDNVVDFFLVETYGYPSNGLYASIEEVVDFLFSKPAELPVLDFKVFFQPRVENALAEFTFNFYLSTGDVISAKTNEISIID